MGKTYNSTSIVVQFDKKHSHTTAIFCYHCFLKWLGQSAVDIRTQLGATEDEILKFVYGFKVLENKESIYEPED